MKTVLIVKILAFYLLLALSGYLGITQAAPVVQFVKFKDQKKSTELDFCKEQLGQDQWFYHNEESSKDFLKRLSEFLLNTDQEHFSLNTHHDCVNVRLQLRRPKIVAMATEGIEFPEVINPNPFWVEQWASYIQSSVVDSVVDNIPSLFNTMLTREAVEFLVNSDRPADDLIDPFINEILSDLSPGDIKRFKKYDQRGVYGILSERAEIVIQREEEPETEFRYLHIVKDLVLELSRHSVQMELYDAGFSKDLADDKKRVEDLANSVAADLSACFHAGSTKRHLMFCGDFGKVWGAYVVGTETLAKTLEDYFLPDLNPIDRIALDREVKQSYNICLDRFFLAKYEAGSANKKIKACVLASLIRAFQYVVKVTLDKEIAKIHQENSGQEGTAVNIKASTQQLDQERRELYQSALLSCKDATYFEPLTAPNHVAKRQSRYRKLMTLDSKDFRKSILGCQLEVTSLLTLELGVKTVMSHSEFNSYYGDRSAVVARSVVTDHLRACTDYMKDRGLKDMSQCRHRIFAGTVFHLFLDQLKDQLREQIPDLFPREKPVPLPRAKRKKGEIVSSQAPRTLYLGTENEKRLELAWNTGEYYMRECQSDVLSESLHQMKVKKSKMSEAEKKEFTAEQERIAKNIEKRVTECLGYAVASASSVLVGEKVQYDLKNDVKIRSYKIRLSDTTVAARREEFNACLIEHFSGVTDLVEFQKSVSSGTKLCQPLVYGEVVLIVIERILYQELRSIGLKKKDVEFIVRKYQVGEKFDIKSGQWVANPKSSLARSIRRQIDLVKQLRRTKPENLVAQVSQGEKNIDELVERSNFLIMEQLGGYLIQNIVQEEAGDVLSQDQIAKFSDYALRVFLPCIRRKSMSTCKDRVKKMTIRTIVYDILPVEIEKEFWKAIRGDIKPGSSQEKSRLLDFQKLDVLGIFRRAIPKPDLKNPEMQKKPTTTGKKLVDILTTQLAAGTGLDKIKNDKNFLTEVYNIFKEDPGFLGRLAYFIIQPELDANYKDQNFIIKFIAKGSFQWSNIKDTPQGKKALSLLDQILRRAIVEGKVLTAQDKNQMKKLVEGAVKRNLLHANPRVDSGN